MPDSGPTEEERREWEARQSLNATVGASDSQDLATPEERLLLDGLRERFAEDFARRKAEGRDHSCCFGEMALLRVLRGNDGDLERTAKWWARFLETYDQEGVEELVLEMASRLDAAGEVVASNDMLPNNEELKEYASALFTLPLRTPGGNVLTYIPLINTDKRAIMEKDLFKLYVPFMRGALALRMLELDRLSKEQGRLVKVTSIIDLAGCSLGWLGCAPFDKACDQEIGKFSEKVSAELYSTCHVINAPWFVTKVWNSIKRFLPERFRRKIVFVEGNPADNAEFVRTAGGVAQLQQMMQFRKDYTGLAEQPSGERDIPRGQIFERCLDAKPGETITWSFEVRKGTGDMLMGISDIEFEIIAFWATSDEVQPSPLGDAPAPAIEEEKLAETRKVSATDGEQRGSYCPEKPGLVVLRWSNTHSKVRSKLLRFSVEVAVGGS